MFFLFHKFPHIWDASVRAQSARGGGSFVSCVFCTMEKYQFDWGGRVREIFCTADPFPGVNLSQFGGIFSRENKRDKSSTVENIAK